MNLLSFGVILGIIIIGFVIWVIVSDKNKKQYENIGRLYAIIYQAKEYLSTLRALEDNMEIIQQKYPDISEAELTALRGALIRKSAILVALVNLQFTTSFESIKSRPFLNVALQKEDRNAVASLLESWYGKDFKKYNIDIDSDELEQIMDILREEDKKRTQ